MEKTLMIVKPDAVKKNLVGKVLSHFEANGLKIVALRMRHLTKEDAGGFYAVHKERPFFDELTSFMSSGPCVVTVLQGEDAIMRTRTIMGATDPAEADEGTIRKLYADSKGENAVHGSDSPESVATEIPYFFSQLEL